MDTQDPVPQLFGRKHSIKMRNNIVRTCKRNGVDPVVVTAEAIKTLTDLLEVLKLEAKVPARTTGKKLGSPYGAFRASLRRLAPSVGLPLTEGSERL